MLPFAAPITMQLGFTRLGHGLYFLYNFFCHQLPERSWFFFGPQISYTKEQIATAFCRDIPEPSWSAMSLGLSYTTERMAAVCAEQPLLAISNELIRRQFIGTPELGWKVAWSDRMVAMYTSIFIFGLIYAVLRERGFKFEPIHWAGFLLLIAPLGLDGTTHLINDAFRLDFRDHNYWAVVITGNLFPASFYPGDMVGSLNSTLRIISGLFFGFGVVAFLWPIMDEEFSPQR